MKTGITLLNFSDIYKEEAFYKNYKFKWVDCSDIKGANCYCDYEALKCINKRINQESAHGLHFIDSGNYHYISKLWTDKITEPFVLIVFDHHPDMQPSLFEGLMSCGCWVKSVLDNNPFIQKVALVGANPLLLSQINPAYQDRLICFSENENDIAKAFQLFRDKHIKYPVYISIDKDVLAPTLVKTNWDQGRMSMQALQTILRSIICNDKVIGIDVSGECPNILDHYAINMNDNANEQILVMLNAYIRDL